MDESIKKEKKKVKLVYCKILEYEIPLSRCKPVREYKKCKSCEGYILKQRAKNKMGDNNNKE